METAPGRHPEPVGPMYRGTGRPSFRGASTTRSFTETVGDATVQTADDIGAVVTATDDDNDSLTYTLEGTDRDEFTIDSRGQIKTKIGQSYDRETKESYSTMVRVDDGEGGTDTIAVTINVTDAEEKPLEPTAPSVSAGSTTSVNVMWNAPSNTGRPDDNQLRPAVQKEFGYRLERRSAGRDRNEHKYRES